MAYAYRNGWTNNTETASSFSVSTAALAGDIVLGIMATTGTISSASGFSGSVSGSSVLTTAGTTPLQVGIYQLFNLGSSPSFTFTTTAIAHTTAVVVAYSGGNDGGGMVFGRSVSTVDGTALTAPSITTLLNGCQIVELWAAGLAAAGASSITNPATSRVNSTAGQWVSCSVSDQAQATAGATGTQAATANAASSWFAATVALAPYPTLAAMSPTNPSQTSAPFGGVIITGGAFSPSQFPLTGQVYPR